ncbi:MerR family transcriptional regulator, partial [Enterococcus faecalis]
ARQDLEERITQLKQIHRNLITYQQKYEEVSQLQEEVLKEEIPPFKTLYYFHPAKAENLLLYLNDPSILGFVLSPDEQTIEHFSTTNKDSAAF